MKVIGAGLSRTGTTSFGTALSTLLDGPCYHGGTQVLNSPESHIKRWIEVIEQTPVQDAAARKFVRQNIKELMDGYVACTDLPSYAFVEELMDIYPDAVVICTIRDPDKWWASIAPIIEKGNRALLQWIFAPIPTLRMFSRYHAVLGDGRLGEIYFRPGEPKHPTRLMWERHMEHLKKIVPPEKLFFYDVREGWNPLCKILNVPMPKTPFPRLNDAQTMDKFMKYNVKKGLMAWACMSLISVSTVFLASRYVLFNITWLGEP